MYKALRLTSAYLPDGTPNMRPLRGTVNELSRFHCAASVPYGITVWNVTDKDSWIITSQGRTDFPTLWD
ncbi:hypothetical protein GCM10027341_30700 [Spirosoma knui]